jgi:hypothetical protein
MEFGAASKLYIGGFTSRRRVLKYVLGVRQVVAAHSSCSLQIFSNTAVRTVVHTKNNPYCYCTVREPIIVKYVLLIY